MAFSRPKPKAPQSDPFQSPVSFRSEEVVLFGEAKNPKARYRAAEACAQPGGPRPNEAGGREGEGD